MIAELAGQVSYKDERYVVISVGEVGYQVSVVADELKKIKLGAPIKLLTYLAVRDDALELYGFREREELNFFKLLLTVPGIGPKSALGILSLAGPTTLRRAVINNDTSYLTRVSGIGRKSAERIVLTLKDKLGAVDNDSVTDGELKKSADALEALKALGYSLADAREALKKVSPTLTDTNTIIKDALKILGGATK